MNLLLKKNEIADSIKDHDKSITLLKPKKTPKSSLTWKFFSIAVVVNNIEQQIVCCGKPKGVSEGEAEAVCY